MARSAQQDEQTRHRNALIMAAILDDPSEFVPTGAIVKATGLTRHRVAAGLHDLERDEHITCEWRTHHIEGQGTACGWHWRPITVPANSGI